MMLTSEKLYNILKNMQFSSEATGLVGLFSDMNLQSFIYITLKNVYYKSYRYGQKLGSKCEPWGPWAFILTSIDRAQ